MYSYDHLLIITVILLTNSFVSTSQAAVYRCLQGDGHVSYQQIRCHQNSKPLVLNHHRSGWTSLRSGEKALLNGYRQKDTARKRKTSNAQAATSHKTKDCWTRRARLDAVKLQLRRGYKLEDSDKLHQQRSSHEDYLRQFCAR